MGGTYWYYVRSISAIPPSMALNFTKYIIHTIDGDLETFSDGEPSTESCPLLPGQTMNILEVPVQTNLVKGRNVSSTSIDSLVFTLDPSDKYLPPGVRRAATTSAIKQRKARPGAAPKIVHRSASTPVQSSYPPKTSSSSLVGQSTLRRQRSLGSVFQRMRQTRSAGSNVKSALAWPRKLFSRNGQSVKVDSEDIPAVPKLPTQLSAQYSPAKETGFESRIQPPPTTYKNHEICLLAEETAQGSMDVAWPHEDTSVTDYRPEFCRTWESHHNAEPRSGGGDTKISSESRHSTPLEYLENLDAQFAEFSAVVGHDISLLTQEHSAGFLPPSDCADRSEPLKPRASTGEAMPQPRTSEEQQQAEQKFYAANYAYREFSVFSYAASEDGFPDLASNTTHSGPMSPLHLSQPETPTTVAFEEDYDADFLQLQRYSGTSANFAPADPFIQLRGSPKPPTREPPPPPPPSKTIPMTPRSTLSGFQGYSLPQDDYKSVTTIRKLPSSTLQSIKTPPPLPQQSGKEDLVHSWNDGSEQTLDDLGYLGQLIL